MKNSYNDLTLDELAAKKEKLHKEYFDLRMGRVLGHVENPLAVRTIRRNIARGHLLLKPASPVYELCDHHQESEGT